MLTAETASEMTRPTELDGLDVAAWDGWLTVPTYDPADPEQLPMYLDRRVYQGSSGRVYPLPFHDRIAEQPVPRRWRAVHLQNEWLHVVVLPGLGGRIHLARDRVSGEDIFWANDVIKPALVGLAGPWLAGGVEFNWPQHHRPATYLPTDWTVVTEEDGSAVVWCSDHDPFARMKGMHGVRLRPDSSRIEVDVRLYNRSERTETFLWWANVAARVDDDYQSFFPHDVTMVADHAKRAVTAFPHADRPYYGIDYPARSEVSTAADGTARRADRLDWYRNIPVPTSYMAVGSSEDFFGGYDHRTGVGFVHVADHQVAVGKKQWTWGNDPFGHAWDANLADDGSHYIELMAGVFTENQPDFSYLAPGETKVFTQTWYPLRAIGPVDRAGTEAAVRLRRTDAGLEVGVVVTRPRPGLEVELVDAHGTRLSELVDLDPGTAHRATTRALEGPVTLTVRHDGEVLISWTEPLATSGAREITAATEPPAPEAIDSVEELGLTGQHLELYRHPTRSPEPYWVEALSRDAEHLGSRTGLALRALRAGRSTEAETHLLAADRRLRRRHPNPQDTQVLYLLGLLRERQGRDTEAYDAYGRAAWTRAWRAAAGYRMARLDARHGRHGDALHRLTDVARTEPEHLQAAALEVVCRRRLADPTAEDVLARARRLDPLDPWLRALAGELPSEDAQTCLDVALELSGVGEHEPALAVLDLAEQREDHRATGQTASRPLLWWYRADLLRRLGRPDEAADAAARAAEVDARWCFPGRLEDATLLAAVLADASPAAGDADLTASFDPSALSAPRRGPEPVEGGDHPTPTASPDLSALSLSKGEQPTPTNAAARGVVRGSTHRPGHGGYGEGWTSTASPDSNAQSLSNAEPAASNGTHPTPTTDPLDDLTALTHGATHHPRAATLLGLWAYSVGRHDEAAALWQAATDADPGDALAWRNLGVHRVNQHGDLDAGRQAYAAARTADPSDPRLRYEQDQLDALSGVGAAERLAGWREVPELAARRDDSTIEVADLMTSTDEAAAAVRLIRGRVFQPWEGGEGKVLAAWERAHLRLALEALAGSRPAEASDALTTALEPDPDVLGEARHPLAATAQLYLLLGDAEHAAGRPQRARTAWEQAAGQRGDFQGMATQTHSETTFWTVLALRRLGRDGEAQRLTEELRAFRDAYAATEPQVDFFATSLPELLLFEEDPVVARDRRVAFFDAQLALLDGATERATGRLAAPALAASTHAVDLLAAVDALGSALLHGPTSPPPIPTADRLSPQGASS